MISISTVASRQVKRCSMSLIIREMQIKIQRGTTSHQSEWSSLKSQQILERCEEKGNLPYCWLECKLVQPLSETVWRLLRKLKTELPCDPAILLLGIYMDKTIIQKDTCIPMFIATLFTRAKKHRNNLNVHQQVSE